MKSDFYARGYFPVDLSADDYTGEAGYTAMNLHFGFILTAEETVKITNSDDSVETVTLPAGIHPVQVKKIWKVGTTTVGSITAFY